VTRKRSKYCARVLIRAHNFRIVGHCFARKYSYAASSYKFEQADGRDAMGSERWKTLSPDAAMTMLGSIASTLDQRKR